MLVFIGSCILKNLEGPGIASANNKLWKTISIKDIFKNNQNNKRQVKTDSRKINVN